jgi:EpsI family protein
MRESLLRHLSFLRNGPAMLVTGIFVIEIALFYATPTAEYIPHPPPLVSFEHDLPGWHMVQEAQIDSYTQSFLKADDTLTRAYVGNDGRGLTLFVAFFKSQRGGVTPHSPKICLPGNGWTPEESSVVPVAVPGESTPIPVNRYIVRHGEDRSLVLYWYSTAHHVIADEYVSKLYLMYEGLRYHRSDEAVYRVIVPITSTDNDAEATALAFIRAIYSPLRQQMWAQS